MDETLERFGRLDVLVNNAGGQFAQAAIDFSPKGWNAVVDTNLNGTWYMMQAAAKRWRDRGESGSVVNIVSSIERGIPQQAHSCAARAGVVHVSRTVAVEWAPLKIRVNCIAPGTIATTGLNNYPPEMLERLGKANPMRETGDVWDIAEAIVYLSGSTGKFITGETVHVNGGSHLWGSSWALGTPEWFQVY
jgi:NAD(P)-dependent dehydrogenase (short-subunit alcohol dehydrogenase family)